MSKSGERIVDIRISFELRQDSEASAADTPRPFHLHLDPSRCAVVTVCPPGAAITIVAARPVLGLAVVALELGRQTVQPLGHAGATPRSRALPWKCANTHQRHTHSSRPSPFGTYPPILRSAGFDLLGETEEDRSPARYGSGEFPVSSREHFG